MVPPPIVLPPQLANRSFGYEVDVYWEFNVPGSLEGWGNATAEQMQMELTVINGEMRGSIVGDNPKVDSPLLFIGVTDRHYTIIRMMYYGESYNARLLMRSGSSPTGRGHNENNNPAYWNGKQAVQAVDSSPSANETTHSRSKSVDGDKYSYYLSSSPAGVFVVFDVGDAQRIREVRILPSGDSNSPKRCLLQMSTTNGQGPFTTVTSFNFPNPLTGVYAEPASPPPPEPYYQPQKQSLFWSFYGNRTNPMSTTTQAGQPTGQPTRQPTGQPTRQPTRHPTGQPSRQPTQQPTGQPSTHPTLNILRGASDFNFSRSDSSKATSRKIEELKVSAFDGLARYWRLLVIDNYGGPGVGIREVSFWGYSEEVSVSPFSIDNTAKYKNYYIPLFPYVSGNLLRLRVELMPNASVQTATSVGRGSRYREAMSIDYIRVAKAPAVWRVRGCLDKYYETASRQDQPQYKVKTMVKMINNHLPLRYFVKEEMQLPYADTYDCSPSGGNHIKVEGLYFGPKAIVFIGGKECVRQGYSTDGAFETILCSTPPSGGRYGTQTLRVQNGVLPGLIQDVPFFSYRNAPPVQLSPVVTNYGARRVDLVWEPPGTNVFDHMMTTGYKVLWFQPKYPNRVSNLTVGNVTTTSIRGLEPATEYIFAVAPMAEGAFSEKSASLETDLYGRRDPTHDALIGTFSPYTNVSATMLYDFNFGLFNANATLNASAVENVSSNGPTGVWGGEGNYGLVLVGSANVQNCNVSSTCCDGYNATIGLSSCGVLPTVCAVLPSRVLAYDYVIDGVTRRQTGTNLPYSNGAPQEIAIFTLEELQKNKGAALPTSACGPALRLTPSEARQSGAAWYGRKVNVREGFDTTITFEISQPSQLCDRMDDVNTFCRSRGADGFAFVVQNVDITALGVSGYGMGYEGIFNSLAVELDTYHNYDMMDFYENHVAVMTQGWRYNISANHSRALATTNRVPDLTDGRHSVRIKYDPNFDDTAVPHPSFQINGFTTWFLEVRFPLVSGAGPSHHVASLPPPYLTLHRSSTERRLFVRGHGRLGQGLRAAVRLRGRHVLARSHHGPQPRQDAQPRRRSRLHWLDGRNGR